MSYLVIHDEDPLPDEETMESWDEGKIKSKKRTFKLNSIIKEKIDDKYDRQIILKPAFEEFMGISKN